MERNWRLGDDLHPQDCILDPVTFDDLILAVHHCSKITPQTVNDTLRDIIDQRLTDTVFLLKKNTDEIMRRAAEGREDG